MKSRRQDTKTERDESLADANRKLRSENKRLLKHVKHLKREHQRLNDLLSNHDIELDLPDKKEVKCKNPCSKCSGKTEQVTAGIFIIRICQSCGHKERKQNDST